MVCVSVCTWVAAVEDSAVLPKHWVNYLTGCHVAGKTKVDIFCLLAGFQVIIFTGENRNCISSNQHLRLVLNSETIAHTVPFTAWYNKTVLIFAGSFHALYHKYR